MRLLALLMVMVVVPSWAAPQGGEKAREECKQGDNCKLPDCMCPTSEPPNGLDYDQVPQFVVLSYDDAVTDLNQDFYYKFKDFKNPNMCRITMTFFLSHLYTNYSAVNELHRLGHEIALHSVTHKTDVSGYWRLANESVWMQEMDDLRTMIVKNANIPEEDLKGWRAPFLEMGGDEMYSAMKQLGLQYDSSWTSLKYTNWFEPKYHALWPYTLDFPSPQDCPLGRCPVESHPGVWVMPMLDLNDNLNNPCAMLDTCQSTEDNELLLNADAVEAFLKRNFMANYYYNKAPFGLYVHHSWFYESSLNNTDARQEGYSKFLLWLSTLDDVFVVSLDRLLAWMKNPKPVSDIDSIPEISCSYFDPVTTCPTKANHRFNGDNNIPPELFEVYMVSCNQYKPKYFPWLYNPLGELNMPITVS